MCQRNARCVQEAARVGVAVGGGCISSRGTLMARRQRRNPGLPARGRGVGRRSSRGPPGAVGSMIPRAATLLSVVFRHLQRPEPSAMACNTHILAGRWRPGENNLLRESCRIGVGDPGRRLNHRLPGTSGKAVSVALAGDSKTALTLNFVLPERLVLTPGIWTDLDGIAHEQPRNTAPKRLVSVASLVHTRSAGSMVKPGLQFRPDHRLPRTTRRGWSACRGRRRRDGGDR